MRILLDENMPHDLVKALRVEGHEAESVHTLGIAGVKLTGQRMSTGIYGQSNPKAEFMSRSRQVAIFLGIA